MGKGTRGDDGSSSGSERHRDEPPAPVEQPSHHSHQHQQAPVQHSVPAAPPAPRLLEYLTHLDQVLIKQTIELLEAFTGFETSNKYIIQNSVGQQIYFAAEDSNCLCRNCFGSDRKFSIKILDNFSNEVMFIERPFVCCGKCNACACLPCCSQKLTIYSEGNEIGSLHQKCSCIRECFVIQRPNGDQELDITGPCCTWDLCCDDTFTITSRSSGETVGHIKKKWSGLVKEMFTDADNFGVSFPKEMDVQLKVCCIAATFLIDFMLYEKGPPENKDEGEGGETSKPGCGCHVNINA